MPDPSRISIRQAAALTGYSMSRLAVLRSAGTFPAPVVLEHSRDPDLYDKQQVLDWMRDAAAHRARKAKPRYANKRPWLEELIAR